MLNILARNENFERLRKVSGLYSNELLMTDGIAKGIGSFNDVVRHGYIQNYEQTMDLKKLKDAYQCIRNQSANRPLEVYTSSKSVKIEDKFDLLNENLDHVKIAS